MVEVFKTNVQDPGVARTLIEEIGKTFADYDANFDLDDCDNILRIRSIASIEPLPLISMLSKLGCIAEILPDHPEQIDGEIGNYRQSSEIF